MKTFCNPLDLSYRFCIDKPSRREAADPTVVRFKGLFFLFASKSGGYWYSADLAVWSFIETDQIPVEEYAPTVVVLGETLFFLASSTERSAIYKSDDPLSGEWSVAVEALETPVWDPALFLDDDHRLYLYWGSSDLNPIYGVELNYHNRFAFVGRPQALIHAHPFEYGWETPGDYNTLAGQKPWIEGPWVTKHNGKYYLQYACPGTEFKSYADGVYVSENPLGPFRLQLHNPFVYKPEGFAAGAGHGSSFADNNGNLWHSGTMTISQKHIFERRLGLFPAFLDDDGTYYSITKYGDFPLMIPERKISGFEDIFPGWMLLTFGKKVTVSSSVENFPPQHITDENIRTYWAAASGGENEFAMVDMGELYDVFAIQLNFAEHDTEIFGRVKQLFHRYTVEYSNDGILWNLLIDKSKNETDNSHNYIQLESKINCRYLKINNIEVPGGNFTISGFRAFGKGQGELPEKITEFVAVRNQSDRRSVSLSWSKSSNATGYMISFGMDKNKLYHNYMVYADTALTINSLSSNPEYYFRIEAFNENGITKGDQIIVAS